MSINEIEEIIMLIDKGFELELISFESDIPMKELQKYKKQLELRKSVNEALKIGEISMAIDDLNDFIKNNKNNIVEKVILMRLNSYISGISIREEDLKEIKREKEKIGMTRNIDEILQELQIKIPQIKESHKRKKEQEDIREQKAGQTQKKEVKEPINEEQLHKEEIKEITTKPDYEKIINRYKAEIASSPEKSQGKRNLLAFAYFKAGQMEEAREELKLLVAETSSYMAYRQLVHIEKLTGNIEDAKLWAYEALDKFPDSIAIREQLISIARQENDTQEVIEQLRNIIRINPKNEKSIKRLYAVITSEGR